MISLRGKISFLFIALFLLFSCEKKVEIYPTQDVTLFSYFPDQVADGKREFSLYGYGSLSYQQDGVVTYPALYLASSDPITGKNLILLDFSIPQQKIRHLTLELYLHYVEFSLSNLELRIYPILKAWKEDDVSYQKLYEDGFLDWELFVKYYFKVKKTKIPEKISKIPFSAEGQILEMNLTSFLEKVDLGKCYGFAVIPADPSEYTYVTAREDGVVSSSGVIEIAPIEWLSWNGVVDRNFVGNGKWMTIKNEALGMKRFSPKLIVYFQ